MTHSDQDRRQRRSNDPITALHYQLAYARHTGGFDALVLAVSLAVTVSAMAVERVMAFDTPEDQKGQAGGWGQAGNLGGSGLGGGLGLYLAEHLQHGWISGAALGLVCLA